MTSVLDAPPMTPYGARYEPPSGLGRRLRASTLDGIRTFGQLTAPLRMRPDYLIIGTKRGGTTSLARWLLEHPGVRSLYPARETRKGTYYFDVNYALGDRWYRSHFPTRGAHRLLERHRGGPLLVGEATPYYLHHPHAPIRARQVAPAAKVIALLRNPVDRAHGHWAERTRQRIETLAFTDAVAAEPSRLAGEEERMLADPSYVSFAHQHFSYVDQGRYARGLGRWLDAYGPDGVLVLRSEDLYDDPQGSFDEVLRFLDLGPFRPSELTGWNRTTNDPIEPDVRDWLRAELDPDIAEVEALLGRSMEWR